MTSQQAVGQQQKVGVGSQGSLGSTWSDPSVNISLDFLSAGLNPSKTPPTLNNIIQQQGIVSLQPSWIAFKVFYRQLQPKVGLLSAVSDSSKVRRTVKVNKTIYPDDIFFLLGGGVVKTGIKLYCLLLEILLKSATKKPSLLLCLCAGVPPINLLAQNFGGLNLSSPPHVTPIRPPANPMMPGNAMTIGMPPSMAASMPPSMTTGTMGIPVNQGIMGMNMSMNMGMTTPVMMGGMAGMGVPGVGMGLTHSITPAMVPPKQDAFANFGSFGKWRSPSICVYVCACVWECVHVCDREWGCMSDMRSVMHWRTALLEDNFACFSYCFCWHQWTLTVILEMGESCHWRPSPVMFLYERMSQKTLQERRRRQPTACSYFPVGHRSSCCLFFFLYVNYSVIPHHCRIFFWQRIQSVVFTQINVALLP